MTDPLPQRIDAERAFDPCEIMNAPFEAFLIAAEECAKNGFMVFILRPDNEAATTWRHQLFITHESFLLAVPAALRAKDHPHD